MILDNLLHNGETDSAASLGGVSRRVCPVEPVENIGQILRRYALPVILYDNLDKIAVILNSDIDNALFLVEIFERISDNIVDYALHLFRIRDNQHILVHIVEIAKLDSPGLHIQADLFHAVPEILSHIDFGKRVWNPVCVNLRVKGQLVDQAVHIVCLVVNRADIFAQLFRRGGHAILNPFHISFNGRDGRFQIVGNIADQLLALLVILNLLLR